MAAGISSTARLVTTLGGQRVLRSRVRNPDELRTRLRRGLPYESVTAVSDAYEIGLKALAEVLRIPERTLARRKRERRLRGDESDRLFRVARIATLAEETLGSRRKAAEWLRRPNRALGGTAPLRQLDDDLGTRRVEDLLGRIAHGVYS